MAEGPKLPVTEIVNGEIDAGGHTIGLKFKLSDGAEVTLVMPSLLAPPLADITGKLEGAVHRKRLETDPSYRRPGALDYVAIKQVDAWEYGVDHDQSTVVIGARYADGTITRFPLPEADARKVIELLELSLQQLRSGNKPLRQ